MTFDEEKALAKRLPKGARKALLALTREPCLPGFKTFNANAAHNLKWTARKYGGLAATASIGRRYGYYITPLGERVRDRLMELEGRP